MELVPKFKGIDAINVFNKQGSVNIVEGNLKFQQDIKHLLETPLGTIPGNLTYGSNLYTYLFMPANMATGTLIQEEIRRRIEANYADIVIDTVNVTFDNSVENKRTIYVSIGYNNGNSNILEYINMDFTGGDIDG